MPPKIQGRNLAPKASPLLQEVRWGSQTPRHFQVVDTEMGNRNSDSVTLKDLLLRDDQEFVVNAYRGILGREPDQKGLEDHLSSLRSGKATKFEVVISVRFSPEGRRRRVRVKGLILPLLWHLLIHAPRIAGRMIRPGKSSASPSGFPLDQTHDSVVVSPPAFQPSQAHDLVVDRNLAAILDKLSEFAAELQILKGVADGLREIRRSERALQKELLTLNEKLLELQDKNVQTQTSIDELRRQLKELAGLGGRPTR